MLFKRYTNAEFTNLYLEYDPASNYDSVHSVDESFVQAMLEDEKALDLFIKRYWVERFRVHLISDNSNILIFYKHIFYIINMIGLNLYWSKMKFIN